MNFKKDKKMQMNNSSWKIEVTWRQRQCKLKYEEEKNINPNQLIN